MIKLWTPYYLKLGLSWVTRTEPNLARTKTELTQIKEPSTGQVHVNQFPLCSFITHKPDFRIITFIYRVLVYILLDVFVVFYLCHLRHVRYATFESF